MRYQLGLREFPGWRTFVCMAIAGVCGCQPGESNQSTPVVDKNTDLIEAPLIDGVEPSQNTKGLRSQLPEDQSSVTPVFTNVAARLGLDFTFYPDRVPGRYFLPEVMGGGVGVLDIDLDGWLDLYFMNGSILDPNDARGQVYGNGVFRSHRSESFQNISRMSSGDDHGYGQGCVAADLDADGFCDLYLSNYGPNVMLQNNGDGTFSNVTAEAGVNDPSWGTSAVSVDLNSDGLLDLYVCNYMNVTLENNQVCQYGENVGYCGPGKYDGVNDVVYVSNGDGSFEERAEEMGFLPFPGKGLAVAVSDFDGDFRPDVYVGNDMDANSLFSMNSQPGEPAHYHDIAAPAGCSVSGEGINEATMGIACSDYDGDGQIDIYLAHYYQMKNTLYRNLGGMLFEDDSFRTGVAATSFQFLGFGVIPFDFNRDAAPDIFIANGHVLGGSVHPNAMTPQLLLNSGKGAFSDVSKNAGPYFEDAWLGRGVAGCDFDDDGDLDLSISHIDRPVALLRNDTKCGKHFVGIELQTANRVPAHCARVTIRQLATDETETQIVGAGGSYLSSSDPRLLFAVNTMEPVKLTIEWAAGRVESFDVQVGIYHRVVEGRGVVGMPK
jgi:hypothetical protein